jgi:hypothetical protein
VSKVEITLEWNVKYSQWLAVIEDDWAHGQFGKTPADAIENALFIATDWLNESIESEKETE